MADLAELVEQVRNKVYGVRPDLRPSKDRLVTGIDAAVVAMDFETPTMWHRKDKAEFEPDGEIVECRTDHPSAADVDVFERGADGTTAAVHSADDIVLKNPQYSRKHTEDTINYAIDNDLWPLVWLWSERTVAGYDPAEETYELDAADKRVSRMYQYDINDDGRYHEFPTSWYQVVGQVADAVPTGATSNKLLRVFQTVNNAATVYYTAKTKPASSDIASLPSEMLEMVVLRSAAALLSEAPQDRRSRTTGKKRSNDQTTDYGLFMAEFTRLRTQYNTALKLDLQDRRRYMRAPVGGAPWL